MPGEFICGMAGNHHHHYYYTLYHCYYYTLYYSSYSYDYYHTHTSTCTSLQCMFLASFPLYFGVRLGCSNNVALLP